MQAAERIDTAGDEAPPVLPASGAAPIRTQYDENHMSDDLEAMAHQLRAAGYITYKPAPNPTVLKNQQLYGCEPVFSNILLDYRRSPLIEKSARRILDRKLVPLNSKVNWRVLEQAYRNVIPFEGEVWEAGVFQGVTALVLANCIRDYGPSDTVLRLFDTYEGMPDVDRERDLHSKGDFSNTSLARVQELVGDGLNVVFHEGIIPSTFAGLETSRVKLVHIDLDLYQPILDTLEFCYPRMERGIFIFDDYGTPTCPGALEAVDRFFGGRREVVFATLTGQAIAFKSG
jgi:O-methyltransferase